MPAKTNKKYLSIPLDTILGERISFGQAELDVLKALIRIGGANTYDIWKESGLKHYPTVLRSLKKLQMKGLSKVTHLEKGRARNIYIPSFLGTLVPTLIEQNREELLIQMSKKSTKFEDLLKLKLENNLKYRIGISVIRELFKNQKARDSENIDKLVKDETEDHIGDVTLEIENERHSEKGLSEIFEELKKFTTLPWTKELVISFLDYWLRELNEDLQNFQRFKKQLALA